MNEPFEQPDQGSGKKKGLIIVILLAVLVLVLGALVAVRLGLPAFQKWKSGGQEETASREESSGGNAVAVIGSESSERSSAAEKPPVILPGIKTEGEAAESAASESAAAESAAAEESEAAAQSTPAVQEPAQEGTAQPAPAVQEPAQAGTEQPAPAAQTAPAQEAAAPAEPAKDDLESLKEYVAGYWEGELTNEESPYLYLYFSPDYSYKMGFKSDQRLTTEEIAKSFKQEITSVWLDGEWLFMDAFFIDGDLHTVSVRKDEEHEDCIIYHRITGTDCRLWRMPEN